MCSRESWREFFQLSELLADFVGHNKARWGKWKREFIGTVWMLSLFKEMYFHEKLCFMFCNILHWNIYQKSTRFMEINHKIQLTWKVRNRISWSSKWQKLLYFVLIQGWQSNNVRLPIVVPRQFEKRKRLLKTNRWSYKYHGKNFWMMCHCVVPKKYISGSCFSKCAWLFLFLSLDCTDVT
jgi:hypothetical protein